MAGTIETGIEFENLPGCIPIFHEVQACHAAGYRYFHDWQELSAEQQSFLIAHYYSMRLLESHQNDASYRHQRAEMNKSRGKGRK